VGRKPLIVIGMVLQGGALAMVATTTGFAVWAFGAVLIGLGTALVYPTLIAAVGDVAHPSWRATAVGVYRLWRDTGYIVGALLGGVVADLIDLRSAVLAVAAMSILSGLIVATRMTETAADLPVEGGPGGRQGNQLVGARPKSRTGPSRRFRNTEASRRRGSPSASGRSDTVIAASSQR
jgi:MFS family permease